MVFPDGKVLQDVYIEQIHLVLALPVLTHSSWLSGRLRGECTQAFRDETYCTLRDISAITGRYTLSNMYLFQFDYKKGQKTGFHIK